MKIPEKLPINKLKNTKNKPVGGIVSDFILLGMS